MSDLRAQLDRLDKKAEAEDAWGLFLGETQVYLKQARESFRSRDMAGAAGDMRKAGACMELEGFGSSGDAKGLLERQIEALEKAAKDVESGSLKSAKRLGRRFAGAQYALARVHYMQADRYYAQNYYRRAVTALQATVTDLERSASWAGKDMKSSSIRVVKQIKDMSRKNREGLRVSPEEISKAISELKKAISRLETLVADA
jgi:tetratricopeptide (TPR) repeat protein